MSPLNWISLGLAMGAVARGFILRVRSRRERDGNDLDDVGPIAAVAVIDAAIRLEGSTDTAAVVHNHVWILPVATEFEARTSIVDEICVPRPIIHVQVNGLAVGGKVQVLAHTSTQMQPDILSARCAYVTRTREICFQIHFAASRRGLNHHINQIIAAFGMRFSPTLPVRKDVKIPAQVKRPWREDSYGRDH